MAGAIVIPDLREARSALGDGFAGFSSEALSSARPFELFRELARPDLNMDDRFNAARALGQHNLSTLGALGTRLIAQLLERVDASTKVAGNGTDSYTLEEKRAGILAAIALQGTVCNSREHLELIEERLNGGLTSMRRCAGEEHLPPQHRESPEQVVARREHARNRNWAHRAVLMLSGESQEPRQLDGVVRVLCRALTERALDDSFKIKAFNALVGRDDWAVATASLDVFSDSYTSPLLVKHILTVMALYRPQSEGLEDVIKGVIKVLRDEERKAQIALNPTEEAASREMRVLFERTLNPRFSSAQASEARQQAAIEPWRFLLHLKQLGSVMVPGLSPGVLVEVNPEQPSDGLMAVEKIHTK